MSTTTTTAISTRFLQAFALAVLALVGAAGCGAGSEQDEQDEPQVQEQAVARGGGHQRAGYTCSGNTCECSKAIENDCENMSVECRDQDIVGLDACINGWFTTHCSCTKAFKAPTGSNRVPTVGLTATAKAN